MNEGLERRDQGSTKLFRDPKGKVFLYYTAQFETIEFAHSL
jgi:hypothetical protein